jgi:hypothetical protein
MVQENGMTEIMKIGTPSVASRLTLAANRICGTLAGEALAAGDACYLGIDGRVYRSQATALNGAGRVRGFAAVDAAMDEPTTLVFDVTLHYGADLPSGASLYLSAAVPGGLTDQPTAAGSPEVAFVIDDTRIRVLQS